ncbi:HTTM domain-containing protein [Pedobacter sp. P351]|uniref:HTTM domain-containing protein n=1 Tax=Pedobacter superstes TaxID=3133441 RepID=UPI00309F1200
MNSYFQKLTHAAPLAVFRIVLGMMLFFSIIRFWSKGWIYDLYITPAHYFPFYGFEFVKPLGYNTYLLFAFCALCAILVAIGLLYRLAIVGLFLSFTYIELIDKSTYLNHYYFISMVLLLMVFLPADRYFSVDGARNKTILADQIPKWCIDSLKLLVFILYFYAGLAKLNSDWLLHALPLKIWLPARNDMPIIGFLFNYTWIAYFFSWFGCFYDLTIGLFLWNHRTRLFAYITVVLFHGLTAILFPIGMFPYIMIVTALIFFSDDFHKKIISKINILIKSGPGFLAPRNAFQYKIPSQNILIIGFAIFFAVQLLMPFRYLLYPGELFWTEEGYRFSWRVMLMEKAGYAQFTVKDASGKQVVVNNTDFLTPLQEKMMSAQADMILQYAHILRDHYAISGFNTPQVYVDSYIALNGRRGKAFIAPDTDLAKIEESFKPKSWILPLNDEIKGF